MQNKLIEQKLFDQILINMPITCLDLLIYNQGRYLLVRRKNEPVKNQLWFPGGRLFKNEKLEAAAIRIAKNEVGLDCVVKNFLGVYETIFDTGPNNIPVHTINITYFLHAHDNIVKLDENHSEYTWANISRIPDELDVRLKDFVEMVFGNQI